MVDRPASLWSGGPVDDSHLAWRGRAGGYVIPVGGPEQVEHGVGRPQGAWLGNQGHAANGLPGCGIVPDRADLHANQVAAPVSA